MVDLSTLPLFLLIMLKGDEVGPWLFLGSVLVATVLTLRRVRLERNHVRVLDFFICLVVCLYYL